MTKNGLSFAALVLVSACGIEAPEAQQANAPVEAQAQQLNPRAKTGLMPNECRFVSFRPTATGTLRSMVEAGTLELAPVGTEVQSMYFDSGQNGLEVRRGVAEFDLSGLDGRIVSAQVSFTDHHGYMTQATPSLENQVFIYDAADGAITTDDYSREAQPFATIATDFNALEPVTHTLDITNVAAHGHGVGVRLELDRKSISPGSFGSSFIDFGITVKLCDEASLPNGALGDPSGVR